MASASPLQPLRAISFIIIGIVLTAPAAADCLPAEMETVQVAAVEDARTLKLADGRLVRPAGIESFALIGADAERADALLAERLSTLLAGRQVRLDPISERPDRYGRHAALVALEGELVQAQLAAEGSAVAFPDGSMPAECFAALLRAEAAARRRGAGLWTVAKVLPGVPGALSPHLGSYVIFEGKVLSVGNRTRRTYLNFGRRWSEDVTVVIESADRASFGGAEALEGLAGRRVRVRGFVEERGGPLLRARWTGQIEALEPPDGEGK